MGGQGTELGWMAGACFAVLSFAFAAMLVLTGPNLMRGNAHSRTEMRWRLGLRTGVLVAMMVTVFACGAAGLGAAKPLRVDFTGMQFDLTRCAADRTCGSLKSKTLFVVGDDPAQSDLVVRGRNYASVVSHRLLAVTDNGVVATQVTPYEFGGALRTVAFRVNNKAAIFAGASCRAWGRMRLCRRGGGGPPPHIRPGDTVHVAIYDLRPITPSAREDRLSWITRLLGPSREGYTFRPNELRSFDLSLDKLGDRLALRLDDPERVTAGTCLQPNMLLLQPVRNPSGNASAVTAESLDFRFLGARTDEPYAPYNLSGSRLITENVADFCTRSWKTDVAALDAGSGAAPGYTFTFHKFEIPWCLFGLGLIALLFVHACCERYWADHPVDGLIVALVQYLLILRMLIGVRGVFLDSQANLAEIGFDAGAAMICLPVFFMALRPVRAGDWRVDLAALAVVAAFAAWLKTWAGSLSFVYWFIFALPVGAMVWRRIWVLTGVRVAAVAMGKTIAGLVRARDDFSIGCLVVILTLAARLGLLWVFHAKEHLFGVSLSIPYLLGLCIGFALIIDSGARKAGAWTGWWFVALFGAAIVVVPRMVNDNGITLTIIAPFAAVALWRVWAINGNFKHHRLWWAPLPAYAAIFGLILAFILLHRPPDLCPSDVADAICLQDSLRYAEAMNDKNLIRVMALFTPGDVPHIGTTDAMESAQQVLHLQTYAGHLTGQGYLAGITSWGNLRDVHFSDNLSAIHIIYPFGRLGAIAVLSVLFCAVMTLLRPVAGDTRPSWLRVAAQLSLWTFFGTGAYMVLANLLLLPFTGRNIYLLAITSVSDLIEGAALLALAHIALTQVALARPSAPVEARDGD